MRKWRYSGLGIVLAVGVVMGAAGGGAEVPTTVPGSGAALDTVVKDLGSDDFSVREAAQKLLDQVTGAQRGELQARAEATLDPEVKARLTARMEAIDEEPYLHPAPVTIAVKNATLNETLTELCRATGYPISGVPVFGRGPAALVRLELKDVPWMEVIRQISEQVPLTYGPSISGVRVQAATRVMPALQTAGPILFVPGGAVRRGEEMVQFGCTMYVDPRMQVVTQRYVVKEARDDTGAKATVVESRAAGSAGTGAVGPQDYKRVNQMPWAFTVVAPARANSITLKAEAELQVAVAYETRELANPVNEVGKTLKVGDYEVTVAEYAQRTEGSPYSFRVTVTPDSVAPGTPAQVKFIMEDVRGKQVVSLAGSFVSARNIPVMDGMLPFHMVVMAPKKVKTITVPFELKDLAMAAVDATAPGRGGRGNPPMLLMGR